MINWLYTARPPRELVGLSNMLFGDGDPEGVQVATVSRLYGRNDPDPGDHFVFAKIRGSDSEGWAPLELSGGRIDMRQFGAIGDGETPYDDAMDDALDYIRDVIVPGPTQRLELYFPAGRWLSTRQANIDIPFLKITGCGERITTWLFNPTEDGQSCFHFNKGLTDLVEENEWQGVFDNRFVLYGTQISKGTIYGHPDAEAYLKYGVTCVDTGSNRISDIEVRFVNEDGEAESGNSASARFYGREAQVVHHFATRSPRGIIIGPNPNYGTIHCDHFHCSDYYPILDGETAAAIFIEPGTVLSDVIFDGHQPWVCGQYGVQFEDIRRDVDTGESLVGPYDYSSFGVVFKNARSEQAFEGGWFFKWTAPTQMLRLENCYGAHQMNGLYMRAVSELVMDGFVFPNNDGSLEDQTGILFDFRWCRGVIGDGVLAIEGSVIELHSEEDGGQVIVQESPRANSGRPIADQFVIKAVSNAYEYRLDQPSIRRPSFREGIRFGDVESYIHPDGLDPDEGTFTDEPSVTGDDANYKIADRTKGAWVVDSVTVYNDGVEVDPEGADPYTVSWYNGAVSFLNGPDVTRVITFGGSYLAPVGWGSRNYVDESTNFWVYDNGEVFARTRFKAPSIFAYGKVSVFGLEDVAGTEIVINSDPAGALNTGVLISTNGIPKVFYGTSATVQTDVDDYGKDAMIIVYRDDNTALVSFEASRHTGIVTLAYGVWAKRIKLLDAASELQPGTTSFSIMKSDNSDWVFQTVDAGDGSMKRDFLVGRSLHVVDDLQVDDDATINGSLIAASASFAGGMSAGSFSLTGGPISLPADASDPATNETLTNALKAGLISLGAFA